MLGSNSRRGRIRITEKRITSRNIDINDYELRLFLLGFARFFFVRRLSTSAQTGGGEKQTKKYSKKWHSDEHFDC